MLNQYDFSIGLFWLAISLAWGILRHGIIDSRSIQYRFDFAIIIATVGCEALLVQDKRSFFFLMFSWIALYFWLSQNRTNKETFNIGAYSNVLLSQLFD
jgi:hypothetical protein